MAKCKRKDSVHYANIYSKFAYLNIDSQRDEMCIIFQNCKGLRLIITKNLSAIELRHFVNFET